MKSGSWRKVAVYISPASASSLEHLEHAVGDQEAADHVDRAEGDRDHAQEVVEEALGRPDQVEPAEQHDAVDGVRGRHQRRVQRVRHLRDDLEADEGGEHQDGQLGEKVHQAAIPAAFRAPSWTIWPSLVMQAPAITSSSKSSDSSPSSLTIRPSSDWTLRA